TELRKKFNYMMGRRVRPTFYNHMPARKVRRIVGAGTWNNYFKFTVERNPWDAQVSLYFWKYRDPLRRPPFETYVRSLQARPQSTNFSIYAIGDTIAVNYVCQYERL